MKHYAKFVAEAAEIEFWGWFSGSKVTDPDGRPLRVYHGTSATFDKFAETEIQGEHGFFFTDNASIAGKFASAKHKGFGIAPGANVRPVYLSLRSPLVVDLDGKSKYSGFDDLIHKARAASKDGVIVKNVDDGVGFYDPFGGVPHDVYIAFRTEQIRPAFDKQ